MLNVVASSTKEMGPGHRHDMLEDLIGDSNWKKVVGLGMHSSTHYFANFWLIRWQGERVLQKIIEAVPERNDHQDDLWEFKKSLSERYGAQLSKRQADFEAWEKDRSSSVLKSGPVRFFCLFWAQPDPDRSSKFPS